MSSWRPRFLRAIFKQPLEQNCARALPGVKSVEQLLQATLATVEDEVILSLEEEPQQQLLEAGWNSTCIYSR